MKRRSRRGFRAPTRGLVLGLTGGPGTGKTTVLNMLKARGALTLSVDALYHDLVKPGKPCWRAVTRAFGEAFLKKDRTLDRELLGAVVFAHPALRRRLEQATHPYIKRGLQDALARARRRFPARALALEIPLLVEAKAWEGIDRILVVVTSRKIQLDRLKRKYPKAPPGRLEAMIASQLPLGAKLQYAQHVVLNNGSLATTEAQVQQIWKDMSDSKGGTTR